MLTAIEVSFGLKFTYSVSPSIVPSICWNHDLKTTSIFFFTRKHGSEGTLECNTAVVDKTKNTFTSIPNTIVNLIGCFQISENCTCIQH